MHQDSDPHTASFTWKVYYQKKKKRQPNEAGCLVFSGSAAGCLSPGGQESGDGGPRGPALRHVLLSPRVSVSIFFSFVETQPEVCSFAFSYFCYCSSFLFQTPPCCTCSSGSFAELDIPWRTHQCLPTLLSTGIRAFLLQGQYGNATMRIETRVFGVLR